MNKALVFGATGRVGSVVVEHLTSAGIPVICCQRSDRIVHAECETVTVDYSASAEELASKIRQTTYQNDGLIAFNCVWMGDGGVAAGELELQMENIGIAVNLLEASKLVGATRFINIGSVEEDQMEKFLDDEWKTSKYKYAHQNYALAKLAVRDQLSLAAYLHKIDFVHIRFSVAIFEGLDGQGYVDRSVKSLLAGEPIDSPTSSAPFNILLGSDLARGIVQVGRSGSNQTNYFIGRNEDVYLEDLFEYLTQNVSAGSTRDNLLDSNSLVTYPTDFVNADLAKKHCGFEVEASLEKQLMGIELL